MTAASQEMAELLAHVLVFDGGIGTRPRSRRRLHRAARRAVHLPRGQGRRDRELAEQDGIDLSESYAYSDSESDLPMLRAVGHPVAVNPDASSRGSRARRAGGSSASTSSAAACGSRALATVGAVGGAVGVGGGYLAGRLRPGRRFGLPDWG